MTSHQNPETGLAPGLGQPQRVRFLTPRVNWRAPASVDSHRSGTMVYEEKNRSGIDTPEVHR